MSTSSPRPRFRVPLALGLAAALALVPGTATAGEDSPLPDEPTTVEQAPADASEAAGLSDDAAGGGTSAAPVSPSTPGSSTPDLSAPGAEADSDGGDAGEGDAPAPQPAEGDDEPPDGIAELRALIAELRDQFPENECVDGVAAALEALLLEIADPEAFEAFREEFAAYLLQLEEFLAGLDPTDLPPTPPAAPTLPEGPDPDALAAALAALGAALEGCVTPPSPPQQPEPPAEEPEQPVEPAQPTGPAPQPVSYPGYAPTGAEPADDGDDDGLLPAALAGAVLLAGGVTAARSRRRAG